MTRLRSYAEWSDQIARLESVPCNYGCGAALPFGDDASSKQVRIAHYVLCAHTSPLMRRAAALIQQNHAEPIAEDAS